MTNCKGCDSRDAIIQSLAKRIDTLEGRDEGDILELPELPTTPELVEYVRQIGIEMRAK